MLNDFTCPLVEKYSRAHQGILPLNGLTFRHPDVPTELYKMEFGYAKVKLKMVAYEAFLGTLPSLLKHEVNFIVKAKW